MNAIVEQINSAGRAFVDFAIPMLIQSGILITVLLLFEFFLRKKVRAVFRYCIWMLILVKLVIPPSFSLPVGIGYFAGDTLAKITASSPEAAANLALPAINTNQAPAFPQADSGTGYYQKAYSAENIPAKVALPKSAASGIPPVSLTWQGAVLIAWLAVVLAMLLLLLQRAMFVSSLARQAELITGGLNDLLQSCCGSIGIRGKIILKQSANTASPAVCGLVRPAILLPGDLLSKLNREQVKAVFLHEIVHIKRGDLWVNFFQTLLQIIYFYNPLLWVANTIIRRVREQAVDEAVQVALGSGAESYPQVLVDVAKMAFKRPALSLRLIGVVESKSALKSRISRMLSRPIPKTAKLGILGLLAIIIIGVVMLPMASAKTGEPKFVIKGTVTEADTGRPIAGAKVGDVNEYAGGKYWAVTDSNGNYSYKTWYEEHNIKAEAACYQTEREILLTKFLGSEKEKILNFALTPAANPKSSGFTATLPNGVTVELVGICEHPSAGKQWWRPDGSLLNERPWDKINGSVSPSQGKKAYEFAFKLKYPSDNVPGWYVEFEKGGSKVSGGDFLKTGVEWYAVELPSDIENVSANVFIATAKWKNRFTHKVDGTVGGVFAEGSGKGGIVWIGPNESDGKTSIVASHSFTDFQQTCIIAVDINGVENRTCSSSSGYYESGSQTVQAFFDLPLEKIKEYRLQTRPYEKYVFKHVSLKPNYKTDVQIEAEKPAVQGEGEKDIKVYQVNRSVPDFPKEDFSKPESAYAAINRVSAGGDPEEWQWVSIKSLKDRFAAGVTKGKTAADPEWAKVLQNAKIIEVRIWKEKKAIVIAELPQEFSSKPIRSPIDIRWLEFEDGKWLNTGNDRAWTIEDARAKFIPAIEQFKQDELKVKPAGEEEKAKQASNISCQMQIDPSREDMQILKGQKGEPNALSGKVVDEKGNPLKGVLVDVWTWYKGNETYTNASGYFSLGGFDPEQKTVEIRFSKDGFTPKYLIRQPLGIKDTTVVLGNRTYFEGIVTASDGKPVADATIKAVAGPKNLEGGSGDVETECKSDKNGYYRLYVQADVYEIQVKADQGVTRLPNIKIDKNKPKKLDIKLGSSLTFFAKAIDSQTQKAVQGIKLSSWRQQDINGVSDSNGLIRIPGMLPGKFEFDVQSEDYCRWWSEDCLSQWNHYGIFNEKTGWQRNFDTLDFDIKDRAEPVVITVEKGVKIKGRVLDPAGDPVAGATATLAQTGSGNSITGDTRYSFETDANGVFEMTVPASKKAKYNLVAHDGKYDQWRNWANGVLDPIQTNPGDIIENITIKLTQPAIVKGIVVDGKGNPVPNNQVRAHSFDKNENRYYDPTARTDANGNFEIKFIRPGKHYIQAYPFWLDAAQAPEGTSQIVTVKAQETVSGIKIVASSK